MDATTFSLRCEIQNTPSVFPLSCLWNDRVIWLRSSNVKHVRNVIDIVKRDSLGISQILKNDTSARPTEPRRTKSFPKVSSSQRSVAAFGENQVNVSFPSSACGLISQVQPLPLSRRKKTAPESPGQCFNFEQ
jgi:hypothetical protein